ncbi:hypothetical protein [Novosphingobium naphthalenivorans]|uniref:hypothetical protein n=1 Tax=Novosphingobium naphthalenivorans TaxID=273168 RepID=UPI0008326EA2|nr:hypothetical protein [Novosphingobium naphthalenivorans]
MSDYQANGWEPDPAKMGNWREMFEPRRPVPPNPASTPRPVEPPGGQGGAQAAAYEDGDAEEAVTHDPSIYKPWVLQRGRSRPPLMLELRRYEPKSGMWQSWMVSYPHLIAVELTGDRLLSLDFGSRQFVIEGSGLDELARHLQQGSVVTVVEFPRDILQRNVDHSSKICSIRLIDIS